MPQNSSSRCSHLVIKDARELIAKNSRLPVFVCAFPFERHAWYGHGATMMRDLLARSRAGKTGACAIIPQAREFIMNQFYLTSFHELIYHPFPIAVPALLHVSVDLPRPGQGANAACSSAILFPLCLIFSILAPQNVPASSGGSRRCRERSKTRGNQSARCVLLSVS